MIDIDPKDIPYAILYVFAFLHLLYFMIYYGRYSSLNQKLAKLDRMDRAGLIAKASIELTRNNTRYRISRMRRICYLPNGIILVIHLVFNLFYFEFFEIIHLLEPLYIGLAGAVLILLGNFTKGAQIFDPNRRFHKVGRF